MNKAHSLSFRFFFIFFGLLYYSGFIIADTIPVRTGTSPDYVRKSIYPENAKNKSKLYNKLWGEHYRELYSIPINVQTTTLNSLLGGVTVVRQADYLHGLLLEDRNQKLYMLKPLGGSTIFMESDFFRSMYSKRDFRNTYLDRFIGDAYTIIHPYAYIASDQMAKSIDLYSNNSRIYYLPPNSTTDTIADGTRISDKLVSVIDVPDINMQKNIVSTPEMLELILKDKAYFVDQSQYIRTRMFDMLTGDWNKVPDNWNWQVIEKNDSIVIRPMVLDRNHAFTKIDGVMFKQLLNILTLGFIYNYDENIKNIKKFNKLGYALDVAVSSQSNEADWVNEAKYIQTNLTDNAIAEAFNQLPEGIRGEASTGIQETLKKRRDKLDSFAREYYKKLQETPVITGTQHADHVIIDRTRPDSIGVRIYNPSQNIPVFNKTYSRKKADEMWIYGLGGDDSYEVTGKAGKEEPIYLVTGKGKNRVNISSGKKIKVFSYPDGILSEDSLSGAHVVYSDDEQVMAYDYSKTEYSQKSINPWGFYDSDLGLNLGTFFTYTKYGFKRMPFSYQHRIGFSYMKGFMYRGIFPTYNRKQTWHLDATFGFPLNYYNFFGFGNKTDGYKDEKRNYNRVNIRELNIRPSFELDIDKYNSFRFYGAYQLYKVLKHGDKFINTVYDEDDPIFKYNSFIDAGLEYKYERPLSNLFTNFEFAVSSGWKVSLRDFKRNFPYSQARAALELSFSKRFSWATMLKGTVLYNDKYEFYQAATTELRGFRNNRFIGQYSFYQYSDFRLDMGNLENAITPLKYGFFAGIDYGRVWYPDEDSKRWHTSYGGGLWLTLFNKITTKYSLFGSTDTVRFMFELGMGF